MHDLSIGFLDYGSLGKRSAPNSICHQRKQKGNVQSEPSHGERVQVGCASCVFSNRVQLSKAEFLSSLDYYPF